MAGVGRPPKGKAMPIPGVVSNPKEVSENAEVANTVSCKHEAENTPIDPGHLVSAVKRYGD